MARQIRINPNALRAAASRQRDIGEMVKEVTASLRSQAMRLDAAWDGAAGSRAVNALMKGAGAVGRIGDSISESARKIQSVADVFENADEQGSGYSVPQVDPAIFNEVVKIVGSPGFAPALSVESKNSLSVEPYALRQVASRCDDLADKLWDLSRNLDSTADALASDWEGRAYDRFAQDTQIVTEALRGCADSLRSTAERIAYAAHRYEEMDEELS